MSTAAAVTSRFRPPRLAVVRAIARRDFRIRRSYRLALVLDVAYGLVDLAVYFFISRLFSHSADTALGGAPSYFGFAAVGIVLGTVMSSTAYAISARMREEQLTGTLEMLIAQPLSPIELCAGLVAFPLSFALSRATGYLVIAGLWMHLDVARTSWIGAAAILLGAAAALAPIGVLSAAAVTVFKRGSAAVGASISFMLLLGGSVFPIAVLPEPLRAVAEVLPLRFAFSGMRSALFTGHGWVGDLAVLVVWAVLLTPVALMAFVASLARARRKGNLGEY